MILSDPFREWTRCDRLRQADIDRLLAAGMPVLALAEGPRGTGFALARDKIVPDAAGRRFEFARHDAVAGEGVSALIALALCKDGRAEDLVAFRAGPEPFVCSWLGRAALLGAEQLWWSRDALTVHPDVLSWLRAGREGVAVVDPVRAATLLRDAGTMEVGSHAERRRLADMLTVRLPDIRVRPTVRNAAA